MRLRQHKNERGVTLIELMIAISLVAILSAGLLTAMRTSLMTYEKVNARLDTNRRAMNVRRILTRQLASAMPIAGLCPSSDSAKPLSVQSVLDGTGTTLRLVTSYSVAEGARGLPQIVEYQVQQASGGGVRLLMSERPYTGPSSTERYCEDFVPLPVNIGKEGMVLEDNLAYCQLSYHPPYDPAYYKETAWEPVWRDIKLPAAVRLEMKQLKAVSGLPLVSITAPIRADRPPTAQYDDRY